MTDQAKTQEQPNGEETSPNERRRPGTAISVIRAELGVMMPEFQNALPSHISAERFGRVALTAIQANPELLEVDRRSVWKACMQAANDGLMPDGKEGAIVVRWDGRAKRKAAAWQPMIAGVRKKAVNAGQISTWDVHAVYANDEFEYELGDDPFIRHKPALRKRGDLVAAYSIAVLKDGAKSREVMGIEEIYAIRDEFSTAWQAFQAGKIKSTPWASAPGEMAKKTIGHRHAKVLPLSSDIRDLLLKGDEIKADQTALPTADAGGKARLTLSDRLDFLASAPGPEVAETIEHDPKTGEIIEGKVDLASVADVDASQDDQAGAYRSDNNGEATDQAKDTEPAKGAAKADPKPKNGARPSLDKIKADGAAAAAKGPDALKIFLFNLTADDAAMVTPAMRKAWVEMALAAGQKAPQQAS
jgi:recombination protein RecT